VNTKLLLSASALAMGLAGIAASFAPAEIAAALGLAGGALVVQLLGALLFGFAMVNWLARGSLLGGIYNRPVAVGNLAHFLIGALALLKAIGAGERRTMFLVAAAVYAIFAIGFAMALFRSPVQPRDEG
jgi:hypothetical protein